MFSRDKTFRWIPAVLLALSIQAPCLAQCEDARLTAEDTSVNDNFGFWSAMHEQTLVISALQNDDARPSDVFCQSGSAYAFERIGSSWIEKQKLTASDAECGDLFGRSLDIEGSLIVLGAPRSDDNGSKSGSAYVFRFHAREDQWRQEQKLVAADAAAGDEFGWQTVVSGDVLVATAYRDGSDSGSAYVFRYDDQDGVWNQAQKLTAGDGAVGDKFGISADVEGDVIVVGAYGDDTARGSAYVFRYNDGTGEYELSQKLTAPVREIGDEFGVAVALHDDVLVISSWLEDGDGTNSGAAYVFRFSPQENEWVHQQKLTASDADASDEFGTSIAADGDLIAIGARSDEHPNGSLGGSAYVFRWNGKAWSELYKLWANDGVSHEYFGVGVAAQDANEDFVVIGSQHHNQTGQSYVYDVTPPVIVHGEGIHGHTRPHSGYIDPLRESTNGESLDQGLGEVTLVFSEPVFNVGGGPIDKDALTVVQTGKSPPPAVEGVSWSDEVTLSVELDGIIAVDEWTTIIADVENACGTRILAYGDLGADNEPDRVDIGFLPGDVDQSGLVDSKRRYNRKLWMTV